MLIVLAFVGLREGELLELPRSDIDGVTGRINVTRKVDRDVFPATTGACPECGRVISAPKPASGVRTVHVPPPFLAMLRKHLLEHTAAGPTGLLFPGACTDHMSVRYLMDRYRVAREAVDSTELGRTKLADYYSVEGEAPGRWAGSGLAGLGGIEGDVVPAEQMAHLFGAGSHPISGEPLGRVYRVYGTEGVDGFSAEVARRIDALDSAQTRRNRGRPAVPLCGA